MARHHAAAEVNLEGLQEEQRSIDILIDSLLNNCPSISAASCTDQKDKRIPGSAAASTPTQAKKQRGRPPKQNLPPSSPVLVNSKTSLADPKPSFGSIVECLKKLSDQSKKLLNFVEVLSDEVKKKQY